MCVCVCVCVCVTEWVHRWGSETSEKHTLVIIVSAEVSSCAGSERRQMRVCECVSVLCSL